jgi:hypothetical protein
VLPRIEIGDDAVTFHAHEERSGSSAWRCHVGEFRRDTGEIRVVDIDSLSGTYVNREAVDSVVLTNGDEIQMGKVRLVFLTAPTTD